MKNKTPFCTEKKARIELGKDDQIMAQKITSERSATPEGQ
jgi:hypothetical protein